MEKKDEKILAKIDKLLIKYGVSEEEKNNFLKDLAEMKDDEEDVEEQPAENEVGEETPTEETPENENNAVEEKTETTEEEKVEESTDDPNPEETPAEEVANESEEVGDEESVEDKVEEKVEEESTEEKEDKPVEEGVDYKAKFEEMQKAFDGLAQRLESLEGLISKLGVPTDEEQKFGASPDQHTVEEEHNDFLEEINRKRMGY